MASIDRSFVWSFPHGRFGAAKSRPPALEPTLPTDAPRDRLRDLTALALLAGVLFLVASLATYHPADPPGARAFPPHARAVNACGFIGSATAGMLYEWLGLGAWFVTALLVGLDVALLRRRDLADLPLKTVGAVLATVKGGKARYAAKGDEIYVRARVTSSKRHSNPYAQGDLEMAWTQPLVTPR